MTPSKKLMVLKIADVVNDLNGNRFWMKQGELADATGSSRGKVNEWLGELLHDDGWVKLTGRIGNGNGGRSRSNEYHWLGDPETVTNGETVTDGDTLETDTVTDGDTLGPETVTDGDTQRTQDKKPLTQDNQNTLSLRVETVAPTAGVTDSFNAFWKICPRKKGKGAAHKAFMKALKIADAETITAAMTAWAASPDVVGKDPQYVCHPSTWLNQERFTDPPWENPADSDDPLVRYAGTETARILSL